MNKSISKRNDGLFWVVSSMVVAAGNYLLSICLSWWLTSAEFGSIAVSQTFIFIGTWILVSGFPRVAVQLLASDESEHFSDSHAILRGVLLANVLLGLLPVAFLLAAFALGWMPGGAAYSTLLPLASLIVLLLALRMTFDAILQGQQRFSAFGVVRLVEVILQLGSAILFVQMGWGAVGALAGFAFGTAISLLVSIVYTRRVTFWRGGGVALSTLVEKLRPVAPMLVANLAGVLMVNLDVLMLSFISGSDEITATYQVSAVLSRIPYFIVQTLIVAAFPSIAKVARDKMRVQQASRQSLYWLLWFVMPINIILLAAPTTTIRFFFPPIYAEAAASLQLLSIGMGCLGMTLVMVAIMQASGNARAAAQVMPIGVLVQLVVGFIWIPRDPLMGAAASVALASLVTLVGLCVIVARHFSTLLSIEVRQAATAFALWSGLAVMVMMLPAVNRVYTALWIAFSVLCYVVVLSLLNVLDWRRYFPQARVLQ